MSYTVYPWYNDTESPHHYHSRDKNKTLEWSGTDNLETYNQNIKDPKKYAILKNNNWLDPIEYKFNNHGFRADAFDDRPAGLALGCSFTNGTGLRIEQVWPSILSKLLNIHVWNLGIGGASFDTVFRILEYYLPKLNPKFVCVLMPPVNRFEYCNRDDSYYIIQANSSEAHSQFAKEWLTQEVNGISNRRKNMLAVQQLCSINNIPVFFDDSEIPYGKCDMDYAKDFMHYGVDTHYNLAHHFKEQISKHHGI